MMENKQIYEARKSIFAIGFFRLFINIIILIIHVSVWVAYLGATGSDAETLFISAMLLLVLQVILGLFLLGKILVVRSYKITFDGTKVKVHKGVFNIKESTAVLTNILSVDLEQSLVGRMLNYGNIQINCIGKHADLSTTKLKNPMGLKMFLEQYSTTHQEKANQFIVD